MKITIDDKVLEKYKLSKSQFFFMLSIQCKLEDKELDSLINKKFYISQSYTEGIPQQNFFLSHSGVSMINKVILESDNIDNKSKSRIEGLAKTLQSMFPKGRKQGTTNYWRGNLPEIKERLQAFFKKFGDYPDEIIIDATKRYLEAYSNNQTTMRTLKYFISKKDNGEFVYDLLTWIENANSDNSETIETQRLI